MLQCELLLKICELPSSTKLGGVASGTRARVTIITAFLQLSRTTEAQAGHSCTGQ